MEAGDAETDNMFEALLTAAVGGELDSVMRLAESVWGASLETMNGYGGLWIAQACAEAGKAGRKDFFEWLLTAGGERVVEACIGFGLEPACRAGRLSCVRFLLWLDNDDAFYHMRDTQSLLYAAIYGGWIETAELLCAEGAEKDMWTFVEACYSGYPELAEWAGAGLAEPDEEDVRDLLAGLEHSCERRRRRIAGLIMEKLPPAGETEHARVTALYRELYGAR